MNSTNNNNEFSSTPIYIHINGEEVEIGFLKLLVHTTQT